MTYYARDVERFQEKFGLPTPPAFRFLPQDLHEFRVKFFNEELDEYLQAYRDDDLATAIDSLIDLVYITCGAALLHGIQSQGFDFLCSAVFSTDAYVSEEEVEPFPRFLEMPEHARLAKALQAAIELFEQAHAEQNRAKTEVALANLYISSLQGAAAMGVTETCWNELWDDVQRANMTKERAPSKEHSKRGSAWDVIKPEGWQPPKTEEILKRYLKT